MVRHFDFYLLRRPLLSVSQLFAFHQRLSNASPEKLLKAYYLDPLAQESIYVASPALFERFQLWLRGAEVSENDRLLITLYKYFVRSCTRSTPYGLFSGCAVGTMGIGSRFEMAGPDPVRKNTRIDFEVLIAIKEWLISQHVVQSQLKVFPNASLYPVGENYRYVEELRQDALRSYFISSVEGNTYLTQIFNKALYGATISELTELLVLEAIGEEEAKGFIEELIINQILVFDLETVITGPGFLDVLISKLSSLQHTETLTAQLGNIKILLAQSDDRIGMYQKLRKEIDMLTSVPTKQDFVQVDTYFSYTGNQVRTEVIQQIQRSLAKMMVLSKPYVNNDIEDFKRKFRDRYDEEEVPLVKLLDQEIGIGYGTGSSLGAGYTPMLDDLIIPPAEKAQSKNVTSWWQKFVLEKYTLALRENLSVVELTDNDLAFIASHQPDNKLAAHSFNVFGNLLSQGGEALDDGRFSFHLSACTGPSAVNIISRFYEGDPDLPDYLKKCVRQEEAQNPDVIFAEIIYCPDSRAGNIMARPSLYQYEIPYMGKASVAPEFQIPVQDLMVSVCGDAIILRSVRLNKRVIPRLSNAHNYKTGLPVYRFLCDLQHQDAHLNIQFDWGMLAEQDFLPQVRYQNIILNRAGWLLQASEFKGKTLAEVAWKLKQKSIPKQFVIVSGDHELFVDSSIPFSLQLLSQAFQKDQTVQIKEFLTTPENCFLEHGGQKYASEMVIPCWNDQALPIPGVKVRADPSPQRRFPIGSEWLYLKVYAGEKTCDTILIQAIYPVVQQLLAEKVIEKFFFIRYADPDAHLRLRFYNSQDKFFYQEVIRIVRQVLEQHFTDEVVFKIQADTYNRELERYANKEIELCETLFHYDSLSILAFLSRQDFGFDENERFVFAMRQINQLLSDAEFSFTLRHELLEKLKESFFNEFNGNSDLRKQLGEKYRFFKPVMEQIVKSGQTASTAENDYPKRLAGNIADKTKLLSVFGSLIHMTVNRLFPSKQRAYELILYHCLAKQYASERSREKK